MSGDRADAAPWRSWLTAIAFAGCCAVLLALPWMWQGFVPAGWIATAVGLAAVAGRRGWKTESLVLLAAAAALGMAFHWAPDVLATALRSGWWTGLAFTVPIVLWDACRLAAPFWFAGRMAATPGDAWLPAGLVAVATEAFVPGVFPWKLGYSQVAWPALVQGADLFGAEWTTFMFFAHAGCLIGITRLARGRPTVVTVAAFAVTVANLAYGGAALLSQAVHTAAAPRFRVALVQADAEEGDGVERLRTLTTEACEADGGPPDLVCWPECSGGSYEESLESFADEAVVFARSREPQRGLQPLVKPACPLLFGGQVYRGYPEKPRALFQSAILVDPENAVVGRYHKRHLMPFGEFVPGTDVWPELRLYFPMACEFDVGEDATVLHCGDQARLGTLLCYEDMLPAAARSLVANSANVLVSLVNGTSFRNPLALAQHRLLAQLRSVESRRCLVRCAATGETCVIHPSGTISDRLPTQQAGVLVADVPLLEGTTLADRLGPTLPASFGAWAAAWGAFRWRRQAARAASAG